MKKISMRLWIILGVLALLFAFYAGWELSYPAIDGTLRSFTRTVMGLLYMVVLTAMLRVHGACQFGKARVSQPAYSQCLSEVMSAGLFYVVAVANSRRFFNPIPLALILVVQAVINVAFCYLGTGAISGCANPGNPW